MAVSPYVVVCGNSVLLAGIRAALAHCAHLKVVTVDPACPEATNIIAGYNPKAVLFDLSAAGNDFAVALLRDQPDQLLIGVDPSSDHALVMCGHSTQALSLTDLIILVDREEPNSTVERRG